MRNFDLFKILRKEMAAFDKEQKTHASSSTKSASKPGAGPRLGGQVGSDQKTSCEVLERGLELAKQKHRIKKKEESGIYELFECPHHTEPDGDYFECFAIVRPDGKH